MARYFLRFCNKICHARGLSADDKKRILPLFTICFNNDKLCTVVSALPAVAGTAVVEADAVEGSCNKGLQIKTKYRREVFANIPCSKLMLAVYATASEVTTVVFCTLDMLFPSFDDWVLTPHFLYI
jgi:hypothetical protein